MPMKDEEQLVVKRNLRSKVCSLKYLAPSGAYLSELTLVILQKTVAFHRQGCNPVPALDPASGIASAAFLVAKLTVMGV